MIEVDLHLHTTCSDGRLSPTALVDFCASRGLKVIALTDHDSTEGIPEAQAAASRHPGLILIPGIELSTDIPGAEIHLLGLFVDHREPRFLAKLAELRDGREGRAKQMVEKLRELGVKISWERVRELADGAVGRPHIAQAMVEAGYVKYPRDAFDKYLGRDGPAYVEREKLTPKDAVAILAANGALPVMAHPTYSAAKSSRGGVEELRRTLNDLKSAGLVGVEVYYGDYTPSQVKRLAGLADELGLIPCGGSDYHASGNPGEPEPGTVCPPMSTYERLLAARPKSARSRR
jgi:predicted metal-dependent phosphoesterase TrpH